MGNDNELLNVADKVVGNLPQRKDQQIVFDPLTALAIASLVVSALRLIVELSNRYCPRSDKAVVARKPGLLQRFLVRRAIKRAIKVHKISRVSVNDVEIALWRTAREATDREIRTFFQC